MPGTDRKKPVLPSPYQGPRPLKTGEALYGRENELSEFYYWLLSKRIVLLYSPSGAGKSSLLYAGLVPRMREAFDVWRPTRVNTERPEGVSASVNRYSMSVKLGLEEGIPEPIRRTPEAIAGARLAEYVRDRPRRAGAPSNLLIIIDQFEEILTVDPLARAEKEEFFDELGELLRDPHIWAVMALREDYAAGLDPYADRMPTHLRNRFRLDRLTLAEAVESIEFPTLTGAVARKFEPGAALALAKRLAKVTVQLPDGSFLDDQDGEYVEPMQLQVVCQQLWANMPAGDMAISEADIDKHGDVTNALAGYYENKLDDIAKDDLVVERTIRDWIETKLITASGIRTQILMGKGLTEGLDNRLVKELVDSHLVRPEQRSNKTWYELAHDRLIRPVRENNQAWREKNLKKAQKDAALWVAQERQNDALLLTGDDLEEAQRWLAENPAAARSWESEFIELSAVRAKEVAEAARLAQEEAERVAREAQEEVERVAREAQEEADRVSREAREVAERARKAKVRARRWTALFALIAIGALGALDYVFELKQEALESSVLAGYAKGVAANKEKEASEKTKVAERLQNDAFRSYSEALESEVSAKDNLARMLQERAANAILSANSSGSPGDTQTAWINVLAAIHLSSEPLPEAAGRLLVSSIYPEFRPAVQGGKPVPNTVAIALRDSPYFKVSAVREDAARFRISCLPERAGVCPPVPDSAPVAIGLDPSDDAVAIATENVVFPHGADPLPWENAKITSVALSRGRVAAGGAAGKVRVWAGGVDPTFDMCRGKVCPSVGAVAWKGPSESLLAAAGPDGGIHLLRLAGGTLKESAVLSIPIGTDKKAVTALAFWPKTNLLIAGYEGGVIRVWDYKEQALLAQAQMHDSAVAAATIDAEGTHLVTAGADGLERETRLRVKVFGRTWELKDIFSYHDPESKTRDQFYLDSLRHLDYEASSGEPRPGRQSSSRALQYFNAGVQRLFVDKIPAPKEMLVWRRADDRDNFPGFKNPTDPKEILLLPDEMGSLQTAAVFAPAVSGPFKVDFEFRINRRRGRSYWQAGDWIRFLFYRKGNDGDLKSFFDGANSAGYELEFSFYQPRGEGFFLLDGSLPPERRQVAKTLYPPGIYTGPEWRAACIEVSPETRQSLCAPESGEFRGVNVYFRLASGLVKVFSHAEPLVPRAGGLGFTAYSGEATGERRLRNVVVTPAEGNSLRGESGVVRFWSSAMQDRIYPKIQDNVILLSPPGLTFGASAVLLDDEIAKGDYGVEFEYTAGESGPGSGFSFLFGADRGEYEKASQLPGGAPVTTGYRLEFGGRGIVLSSGQRFASNLPDVFSRDKWRKARVEVRKSTGRVRVVYEGTELFDQPITLKPTARSFGFGVGKPELRVGEIKIRNVVLRALPTKL